MADKYHVPGPCTLSWGGASLGGTKAGVSITPQTHLIPIVDDEHGNVPADWIRAGKSATITVILNDPSSIKTAVPFIGGLLSIMSGATSQVGKLAFAGDPLSGTFIGKEFIITEANGTDLWKAKYVLPADPEQLMLASTQELLAPITFVVAPDENGSLFYTLPSYLT